MLRVQIVDRYEIVRRGIRRMVELHPGWVVCGEASDGRDGLEFALDQRPDVVVLEVAVPGMNGLLVTRRLAQDAPGVNVLIFADQDDHETVRAALAAGARGYVLKTDSVRDLQLAIGALGARKSFFTSSVSELLLGVAMKGRRNSFLEGLTPRELEVGQLIAEGNGNKRIARLLNISIKTVESHRAAAMRKAGSRTASEFVRYAIKQHLIQA